MFRLLRPKHAYVTCAGRTDGGGAQIAAQISTMIFARSTGLTYAHTPLCDVAHRPDDIPAGEWAASWERFFNLGQGETPASDLIAGGLAIREVRKPHRGFFPRSRTLHQIAHCHKVTDHLPDQWQLIAGDLREKYYSSPKPRLSRPKRTVSIALHLRRGDVSAHGKHAERFTADDDTLAALDRLVEALGSRKVQVEVYSQGREEDFSAYLARDAALHLDEDVFTTFHHLATADILFTAKSTFSYLAGVIGGGRVIYEPFWHPCLRGWLTRDQLDQPSALEAFLRELRSHS